MRSLFEFSLAHHSFVRGATDAVSSEGMHATRDGDDSDDETGEEPPRASKRVKRGRGTRYPQRRPKKSRRSAPQNARPPSHEIFRSLSADSYSGYFEILLRLFVQLLRRSGPQLHTTGTAESRHSDGGGSLSESTMPSPYDTVLRAARGIRWLADVHHAVAANVAERAQDPSRAADSLVGPRSTAVLLTCMCAALPIFRDRLGACAQWRSTPAAGTTMHTVMTEDGEHASASSRKLLIPLFDEALRLCRAMQSLVNALKGSATSASSNHHPSTGTAASRKSFRVSHLAGVPRAVMQLELFRRTIASESERHHVVVDEGGAGSGFSDLNAELSRVFGKRATGASRGGAQGLHEASGSGSGLWASHREGRLSHAESDGAQSGDVDRSDSIGSSDSSSESSSDSGDSGDEDGMDGIVGDAANFVVQARGSAAQGWWSRDRSS